MTIYPSLKYLKHLFKFYDDELAFLLKRGFARDEAEHMIKHFLEVFAISPESYRYIMNDREKSSERYNKSKLVVKWNKIGIFYGPPIEELRKKIKIKSNLGYLVER
jgi:hypothetical protein